MNANDISTWSNEMVNKVFEALVSERSYDEQEQIKKKSITIKTKRAFLIAEDKLFRESFGSTN